MTCYLQTDMDCWGTTTIISYDKSGNLKASNRPLLRGCSLLLIIWLPSCHIIFFNQPSLPFWICGQGFQIKCHCQKSQSRWINLCNQTSEYFIESLEFNSQISSKLLINSTPLTHISYLSLECHLADAQ